MEQRETFDAVADLYGEARPGYPAALYGDLGSLAGLGPRTAVLEVGCGAGQATRDLAVRARAVTALDPGPRLIDEARRRVQGGNVEFVVSTFEAYDAAGAFDVVVSAQAWHWVDPVVGLGKAARMLRDGGALAIFGHVPFPPTGPLATAFQRIYDAHLPGAWGQPPGSAAYLPSGPFASMIETSGLFGPVLHRAYAWTWRLDPPTFGRYMRTDSSYHVLAERERFALFDELSSAVADAGGVWEAAWETHLYVARKR
jgi:SAM-dependent methyltransferase